MNYDLPWNPARLVQRIGRLYRYGQTRRVQVINLQADDGFDNQAIALMLDRVETMARDLSAVAAENREALEADILGELLANVDMEEILERASTLSIERTEGEISEAIAAAEKAREVESSILAYADEHRGAAAPQVDARHMLAFVEGMIERLGGAVAGRSRDGRILEIELPEGLVGEVPEFGRRRRVRVTASPRLVRRGREEVFPLDFDGTFVRLLAAAAEQRSFDGLFASGNATGGFDVLGIWQVRWQDTEGTPLEEALVPVAASRQGDPAVMNPAAFSALLLEPLKSAPPPTRSNPAAPARTLEAGIEAAMRQDAEPGRMPGAVFLHAALSTS